ncbi:NAD(P)H-hydrate epimerase [Phlyctochytrium planicorne]|nr:NAD(P)H-hydrate epimerase [Phlyctochytrium planicorne]
MAQIKLLSQTVAQNIDVALMDPTIGGFSIFQLMELAGLSVAQAVLKAYPVTTHPKVLVVAGPGNNGGDALVAARHLKHFGYSPSIVYPKQPQKELFLGLVQQLKNLKLPIEKELASDLNSYNVILDGIFGFSFSGEIRAPFDTIIARLKQSNIPIASIDIPSGWDVEKAPKLCAKFFKGRKHYLGGRFIPEEMEKELELNIPRYPDGEQVVELTSRL